MRLKEHIKNMKVKNKMRFYGIVMIGVVMFLGIISGIASICTRIQTKDITEVWVPGLTYAREIDTLTSNYRLQQYGFVTAMSEEKMAEYEAAMQSIDKEIMETSALMQSCFTEPEEYEMMESISSSWAEYKEKSAEVIALSRSGNNSQAGELMVGEIKDIYDDFGDVFDRLVAFEQENTDRSARNADILFNIIMVIIVVVIAVAILIVLAMSTMITDVIVEPLHRVSAAMDKLYKEGDLNFELSYDAKDEFGKLVGEINDFAGALVTIIRDEGYLMGEMSKGNFNIVSTCTEKYVGDFEMILTSMRGIKMKLGTALSGIAESAQQVSLASNQMAQESQSLADGAAEQSAAIEEIVTTMENLELQSERSAEKASDANHHADDVKEKAEVSNKQMNDMVLEMERLAETSKKIETIIDDIEEIASQTNLLSLNASIEAARAGEAGRGFAVVADEIGKLALQCSQSAGNTRSLIGAAIEQTTRGNEIASNTAEALYAVSEGIIEIAALISEVRESCESQCVSLKEVDQGMEEISGIVESNSASAEESAATSEELAAHADNLNTLLSEFTF